MKTKFSMYQILTKICLASMLLLLTGNFVFAQGRNAKSIRVLMIGGGSSHDFDKWYKQTDSATLAKDGFATVKYTSDLNTVMPLLKETDVLFLTTNQPGMNTNVELQKALMEYVNSGKGLVLSHAGIWYNWKAFPEYNTKIVGGGTRGHEKLGPFEVTITNTKHPITKGITETKFTLRDELYRDMADTTAAAPGMEVLAIATVNNTTTTYPQLWITKNPKSRIVCFTLGHDGDAHDRPVYQQILKNAVRWAATGK